MFNKKNKQVHNNDKNVLDCNEVRAINTGTSKSDNNLLYYSRIAGWLNQDPKKILMAACWVMLFIWCIWWSVSFYKQDMLAGKHLWFPTTFSNAPTFGIDFYNYIDHPARTWWDDGDPYGDKKKFFAYPPSEMRLFAWVNIVKPRAALGIWLFIMTAIMSSAALMASRWRQILFLNKISPVMAVVLILFSTPVVFAIERGQYDPLSLLFIIASLPLLNHSSRRFQYLAGAVLCMAPWVKVYPGLIFVGLIGLKRWRALAGFAIFGIILLAALDLDEMRSFLVNNAHHIKMAEYVTLLGKGTPWPWNHPLTTALASMWLGTKFSWLGLLPSKIIAIIMLMTPLTWVTYHVYKCPRREALAYPYLLWIVALATFVPPISNDYNLCFLPIAVLAVWQRHDPLFVQIALGLFLLWWQPIGMSIPGMALLIIKLMGLYAVGVLLVKRAGENSQQTAYHV